LKKIATIILFTIIKLKYEILDKFLKQHLQIQPHKFLRFNFEKNDRHNNILMGFLKESYIIHFQLLFDGKPAFKLVAKYILQQYCKLYDPFT